MVKRLSWVFVGILVACCGPAIGDNDFPYRYYTLAAKIYQGSLLGAQPSDDLDFGLCEPKPGKENPCIVIFKEEFLNLKRAHRDLVAENKDLRRQLDSCNSNSH